MAKRFLNIAEIDSSKVKGAQTKIAFNGVEIQRFTGAETTRDYDEQVRKALIERNKTWEKLGITARGIQLAPLKLCVYSETSNLKIHGLYYCFS